MKRVGDRAVGGAVVGHQPLDLDPVGWVEGEGAAQGADRRLRLLVPQHLEHRPGGWRRRRRRVLLVAGCLDNPSAKEARMNNVVRNCS
jgi:hypothetical protein